MFITKLSEVNSCINQALQKQRAPLPHFNFVHSVVKQDFRSFQQRYAPYYVSICNTLLLR